MKLISMVIAVVLVMGSSAKAADKMNMLDFSLIGSNTKISMLRLSIAH
jgi:hypothetical protein